MGVACGTEGAPSSENFPSEVRQQCNRPNPIVAWFLEWEVDRISGSWDEDWMGSRKAVI